MNDRPYGFILNLFNGVRIHARSVLVGFKFKNDDFT
ncbi:hypothetical protein BMW23_0151 [Bodo saltans virus]|uniref:Uncharacterized protein n=1 Tax=Bodo saltans virus TaxID=2024608 RepID=A0A2H4UTE4_9VIRU|nr:hypothetical protein QJ851_gp0147 [Bodo saltans virus]ATZ80210.1 hypothetical protein BMW23_0151 [Bodo saltans virus]